MKIYKVLSKPAKLISRNIEPGMRTKELNPI